mmetsp:Transcript_28907/g.25565  ORF Transcript_28907/g.25565 Transcript_28907/m.25565 type:complete len:126 (-) Transcript_28907:49-426(-)
MLRRGDLNTLINKNESATDILLDNKFLHKFAGNQEEADSMCKEYKQFIRKIGRIPKKLIKLRNQLLNTYKDFDDYSESTQYYLKYTKKDIAQSGLIFEKVRQAGFLNIHNLWDIPKKKGQDRYKD